MLKKFILILVAILFICTSCTSRATDVTGEVKIMCQSHFQEDMFMTLSGAGIRHDKTLASVNCLTEEDYTGFSDWYESLYTGLLTHSEDFDIYVLNSMDEKTYKIIKDHYYIDLSQDEGLMHYFDAMYPEIKKWCTFGDEVFGFPLDIEYYMGIAVNEEQMSSMGYIPKNIRTMEGLLDFCGVWSESNSIPPTGQTLYLPNYYINYMLTHYIRSSGKLDLDTSVFRSILTQCKQYQEENFLQDDNEVSYVEFDKPVVFRAGTPLVDNEEYNLGYYPLLKGETSDEKRYVNITWFIINPSSKNLDQALKYMNLLAESAKYTTYSGLTRPVLYQNKNFYESDLLSGFDYQTFNEIYSDEQFLMLNNYLAGFFPGYGFSGYYKILGILNASVIENTKTLNESIAEAQALLDTIQQEQYIGEN